MKYDKSKSKDWITILVVVMIFGLITIVLLSVRLEYSEELYEINEYKDYLNCQEYEDGSRSFQIDLTGEEIMYDLMIRTSQQEMIVIVGEEVIYECVREEDQFLGEMPTSQWNLIRLTEDEWRDELVTVQYYSSYDVYMDNVPFILYGTSENLISYITIITLPICLIAWVTILLGAGCILFCIIYKHHEIYYITYLGMFLIIFGMWSWGESKTLLFHYTEQFLQSQITFIMVMVIPLPLVCYLRCKAKAENVKNVLGIYGIACVISVVVGIALALMRIIDLIEYLMVTQVLIVIGIAILIWGSFFSQYGLRRSREKIMLNKIAVFVLSAGTALEIFNLYFGTLFSIGTYIRIGVVMFILMILMVEIIEFREKRERIEVEEERMKRQLEAAKLQIMNDKMTPHFIHNTMVAIQELCYSDPEEAARSIGIFSKYIRINLEGIGEKKLIPFKTELEYIQLYMDIQLMCFEEDIKFETELQVMDFGVPPFSIQPLIENAIVHGIRKCLHKGFIVLRTWREEDVIIIQIEDNGIGFDMKEYYEKQEERFNSGSAVAYRIEQLLGGQIIISSKVNRGTVVTIQIPANNGKDINYD